MREDLAGSFLDDDICRGSLFGCQNNEYRQSQEPCRRLRLCQEAYLLMCEDQDGLFFLAPSTWVVCLVTTMQKCVLVEPKAM